MSLFGLSVLLGLLGGAGCTSVRPPEHGTALLVEVEVAAPAGPSPPQTVLANTQAVLRKRLERSGLQPSVAPAGTNRIQILLPTIAPGQMESLRRLIRENGIIEFRFVHGDSARLIKEGTTPAGFEIRSGTGADASGRKKVYPFLVSKQQVPGFSGKNFTGVSVIRDNMNRPMIAFKLDSTGTEALRKVSSAIIGGQLAILIDGELYSAPIIREPILKGIAVIQGNFSDEEAFALANLLLNPLEAPVKLLEERNY